VAIHPVRARAVDLLAPAVAEVVAARMLEEAADDRADPDVLGDARKAGPQAADAADDEVDLDAGDRGFVERADHLRLDERIQLRDDPSPLPGGGAAGLAPNQAEQPLVQIERR